MKKVKEKFSVVETDNEKDEPKVLYLVQEKAMRDLNTMAALFKEDADSIAAGAIQEEDSEIKMHMYSIASHSMEMASMIEGFRDVVRKAFEINNEVLEIAGPYYEEDI